MSDTPTTAADRQWLAASATAGPQHSYFLAPPLYVAAGARRAQDSNLQEPSSVYVATRADGQYAVGVVCVGVPESYAGYLAAQGVGGALAFDWWENRRHARDERTVTDFLRNLQTMLDARIGPAPPSALRRPGALSQGPVSQTSVGAFLLARDGTAFFYLLGQLQILIYAGDTQAPPTRYTGTTRAAWSSEDGVVGQPLWRSVAPAQAVALTTLDFPQGWGDSIGALYDRDYFDAAVRETPPAANLGYAVGAIAPRGAAGAAPPPDRAIGTVAGPLGGVAASKRESENVAAAPPPPDAVGRPFARPAPVAPPDDAAAFYADAAGAGPPAAEPPPGGGPTPPDMGAAGAQRERQSTAGAWTRQAQDRLTAFAGRLPAVGGLSPLARLAIGAGLAVVALLLVCGGLFLLAQNLRGPQAGPAASASVTPGTGIQSGPIVTVTADPGSKWCYQQQNACIQGRFLAVWQSDGGEAIFGQPLANARYDGGRLVQDFQRFRFELHTENQAPYDVLFANLGDQLLLTQHRPFAPATQSADPNCRWFDTTQHNVCSDFLQFWLKHGRNLGPGADPVAASTALFGLPTTEAGAEVSLTDGKTYLTQWFQRARFELHPEAGPDFRVQLSLLNALPPAGSGP